MEKILALFGEIKGYFAGIKEALAKVTAAEDRCKALELELVASRAETQAEKDRIVTLSADLETAQGQVNAHGTEIKNLQAALAAEKSRANNTIAGQGLALDQVPAASTDSQTAGNAWTHYQKLLANNPSAAGEFYAKNADAILSSRPK